MDVNIQVKRLGKKKVLTQRITLRERPTTLRSFIEACVFAQVREFNEGRNKPALDFLTSNDIASQATRGKVGFGDITNQHQANLADAIENAMLGFTDGLFVVFINDEEIRSLDSAVELNEDSQVTFVRMTFLSGGF
jgi:hypothetical protein